MNNLENKKLPVWLIIGIVLVPLIFSWFTLRQGYSKKARTVSFAWLVMSLLFVAVLPAPTKTNVDDSTPKNTAPAVEPKANKNVDTKNLEQKVTEIIQPENSIETIKKYDKKIIALRTHGENVLEVDLPATEVAFSDAGYIDHTSRTTIDILIKILKNKPKEKFKIIRFVIFADLKDQYNNVQNEPIFQLSYDYAEIQKINLNNGYLDHRLFLNFAKFGLRSPVAHSMFDDWCAKGDNAERSGRFCK